MKTRLIVFFPILILCVCSAGIRADAAQLIPSDATGVVTPGGDTTGNGSGPDIKKVISIESRYASIIDKCLKSSLCGLTQAERTFTSEYLKGVQKEELVEFVTSKTHPDLVIDKDNEKLYLTGSFIGSENLINSRTLSIADDEDAFILLTSIYANHLSAESHAQLADILLKFVVWLARLGDSSSMAFWSQYHIQFYSPSLEKHLLILTDGQFEKLFTEKDFFNTGVDCAVQFEPVKWVLLNKGHSIATGPYTRQCPDQPLEQGRIEYRIDFVDGVDWVQFEGNSKKIILQIKKVSWHKSVF